MRAGKRWEERNGTRGASEPGTYMQNKDLLVLFLGAGARLGLLGCDGSADGSGGALCNHGSQS